MAEFVISLGNINKKLLIPLIYIIIYTIIQIFYLYYEYNEVSLYIQGFGFSIGQILTYFIGNIIKYRSINEKKNKRSLIKSIKDYLILFFIDCFYMIDNLIPYYFFEENTNVDEKMNQDNQPIDDLFIADSIEIIFLTLITFICLKYKYYIHHIISIIIFTILCIIIDLILKNFTLINKISLVKSIAYILVESIIYSYFKYLIDNKYYFFMDVLFALGIFNFIVYISSFGIILFTQYINGTNKLLFQFFEFYSENGIWYMLLWFIIGLILVGFCVGFLEFLTLNILTPDYIIISYCFSRIPSIIISIEGINRWIILTISIFQILSLLFYLEILEYNFCDLNKNTKKNIEEREKNEIIEDNDNEIIVKGYDISEGFQNQATSEDEESKSIN